MVPDSETVLGDPLRLSSTALDYHPPPGQVPPASTARVTVDRASNLIAGNDHMIRARIGLGVTFVAAGILAMGCTPPESDLSVTFDGQQCEYRGVEAIDSAAALRLRFVNDSDVEAGLVVAPIWGDVDEATIRSAAQPAEGTEGIAALVGLADLDRPFSDTAPAFSEFSMTASLPRSERYGIWCIASPIAQRTVFFSRIVTGG